MEAFKITHDIGDVGDPLQYFPFIMIGVFGYPVGYEKFPF
jgi:hypothetical protein